jgi:hypothetical protein
VSGVWAGTGLCIFYLRTRGHQDNVLSKGVDNENIKITVVIV